MSEKQKEISIYLQNARKIQEWIKKENRELSKNSTDPTEKKLAKALDNIRNKLVKPYNILEDEVKQEEYKKEHPEIDEIIKILDWIKETVGQPYLTNAREIKKWIEEHDLVRRPNIDSKDPEEKKLGMALRNINRKLIKPYLSKKTEGEKNEYRKNHPEIEEVIEIINWINKNVIPTKLKNARDIQLWMEEIGARSIPNVRSSNKEEKKLGIAFKHIQQDLLKPYLNSETEEKKEEFREEHPELDEIMQIFMKIYQNYGTENQKLLLRLMKQDCEIRVKLKEAKELEVKLSEISCERTGEIEHK